MPFEREHEHLVADSAALCLCGKSRSGFGVRSSGFGVRGSEFGVRLGVTTALAITSGQFKIHSELCVLRVSVVKSPSGLSSVKPIADISQTRQDVFSRIQFSGQRCRDDENIQVESFNRTDTLGTATIW
jgi:hypothetical protein